MKKIISIILAIIAIFAMSVNAFAFTSMPEKKEPEATPYVSVMASLEDDYTPMGAPVIFEKYENPFAEKDEEKIVSIEGRIFKIKFSIYNSTKDVVYVDDVLEGFGLSVINANTEKNIDCWTKAKDTGFGTQDLTKMAINPANGIEVIYKIYAITDKAVTINVSYEDTVKNVETTPVFMLINDVPATPDTPTTETTTESTTKAPETSTEAPTESKPADTTTTTKPADTTTEKAPADVDPEIPDTGATVPFAAIGTLVTSAITALVAKKKKEN
jgi:hypothetical protein